MAYADETIAVITIACEAENQPHNAKVGVAATILNRLRDGRWGKSAAAVCLQRLQFSEWNDDRPDNANLVRVAVKPADDPVIVDCLAAWHEALVGADPTNGATHFYADDIPAPNWTVGATQSARIGAINFFSNVR